MRHSEQPNRNQKHKQSRKREYVEINLCGYMKFTIKTPSPWFGCFFVLYIEQQRKTKSRSDIRRRQTDIPKIK